MGLQRVLWAGLCALACAWVGCSPTAPVPGELSVGVVAEDGAGPASTGRQVEFRFALTAPGESSKARLIVRNIGTGPLTVESIARDEGGATAVFQVGEPQSFVLNGRGERGVELTFAPEQSGAFVSKVRVRARDSVGEQVATVILVGISGSEALPPEPDISVLPFPTLEFGPVMVWPEAPVAKVRKLTVFNVGSAATHIENLVIERVEVRALDASTSGRELEVRFPEGWNPSSGLRARAGQNALELEVRVTPRSVGPKRWQLTVHSNDPDEPALSMEITAQGIAASSCRITAVPDAFDLGSILWAEHGDLTVSIKNEGSAPTEQCAVWGFTLGPDSDPGLSLPFGTVGGHLLEPGETLKLPVRVTPRRNSGSGPLVGTLEFKTSSSQRPYMEVPIRASFETSCLTIAPDDLDFGTVVGGCESPIRTFALYNVCSHDVVLSSFSMVGTSQPGALSEFTVVRGPAIPIGGLAIQPGQPPVVFQLRYTPVDFGADNGTIALDIRSGDEHATYVVSMSGRGDANGLQTDVFFQDPPPKADILFVIDNSPSMAAYQQSVAANLDDFLQYALNSGVRGVDFQLAVVSADPAQGSAFLSGPTHPEKVLTRSTPNIAAKFASKVNVGTNGSGAPSCLERALAALTAPMANAENAGFLRDDSALSVICITASRDHGPRPVSEYLDGFWGIKGPNRRSMFTFNAIGGFSSSCPGDTGALADAVIRSNGVRDDICTPDWERAFHRLGTVVWSFGSGYSLSSVPDLSRGTIEVIIDGRSLPPVDAHGATVWRYDSTANSIRLEPMYELQPGSTMTITYFTGCYR
ncbi:MAG: hypothetical protein WBV82_08245 [Myxococcaceae bacterium]